MAERRENSHELPPCTLYVSFSKLTITFDDVECQAGKPDVPSYRTASPGDRATDGGVLPLPNFQTRSVVS